MPRGVEIKRPEQIRTMRRAGLVVAEALNAMGEAVAPGVTTGEIDALARDILAKDNATSSFLNYGANWGIQPYPGVICISVNDEVVHGIPGDRVLADGDIVSIDFGAIVEGWHGDAARTFFVGQPSDADRLLAEATRRSMWDGIAAARLGGRVTDISAAVQASIERSGQADGVKYGIVREFTGHGIGSQMHQDPDVPNFGRAGRGPKIVRGLCLAVEPMLTMAGEKTVTLDDDWTVITKDRSRAAHWENTMTVTSNGIWVLTEPDGGEAELTARGVPFGG